jgi:diaminopimelate decarboxylase/aspartate kinase
VVDEGQGERLVEQLHELLIRPVTDDRVLGPTWEQLFAHPGRGAESRGWWHHKRAELLTALGEADAAYVYDRDSIRAAARALRALPSVARVLFAMKANAHPQVLQTLHAEGIELECVSRGEVERVLEIFPNIERNRILFTPNFAARAEYAWAFEQGVSVTVDNGYALASWPELFAEQQILVRIDTGAGRGHHQHVRTAGINSKFGVPVAELDDFAAHARAVRASVIGLHAHAGSGIFNVANWQQSALLLAELARRFPLARIIDVGGGFGVPERQGDRGVDLPQLDAALAKVRAAHPHLEIWVEPGRYLVAAAGVLLARVTQLKSKGEVRYVGVATGMNSLIRPALYGAYHEIVNLTRLDEPAEQLVNIVGPICESGDILGHDRLLPVTREGDVLLVSNAGAYGYVMSSHYNLRAPAPEVCL